MIENLPILRLQYRDSGHPNLAVGLRPRDIDNEDPRRVRDRKRAYELIVRSLTRLNYLLSRCRGLRTHG
jgi:hypothetical protein